MGTSPRTAVVTPGHWTVRAAAVGAARAAASGIAVFALLVLLGWSTGPRTSSLLDAVRTGGQVWLAAHHTDFTRAGGDLHLAPLGLAVVPAVALGRAAVRLTRSAAPRGIRGTATSVGRLAVPYAAIAAVVSVLTVTDEVRPHLASAVLGSLVLAVLAAGIGVVHGADLASGLTQRVPGAVREVGRAAAVATAVLLGGGALLVAASLAVDSATVGVHLGVLDPDPVGGVLLLLLTAAAVPNAVLCATAYAVGPGFAVGTGTTVAPSGTVLGALPAMPLLAVLPEPGDGDALSWSALAVPLAAGVAAGLVVRRSGPVDARGAATRVLAVGALVGVALALLTALAGGAVADGRLAEVGASSVQVGLAAAAEVASVSALVVFTRRPRRPAGG